jgi:hypothetical protein
MKKSIRTKTSKRRFKIKLQKGGVIEDNLDNKLNALESFITEVNPTSNSHSSLSKSLLKFINKDKDETNKGGDITSFILQDIKEIKTKENKCTDEKLKKYVSDIQYIIENLPDALVLNETKQKLRKHLDEIGCEVDNEAVKERVEYWKTDGGRKTRRQRRNRK